MATLRTILLSLLLACAAQGQTLKSLMYNTTNGRVTYTNTNTLTFAASNTHNIAAFSHPYTGGILEIVTTDENLNAGYDASSGSIGVGGNQLWIKHGPDSGTWARPLLIDSPVGNIALLGGLWLTNTNVTNFRTAIGFGTNDNVRFADIFADNIEAGIGTNSVSFGAVGIDFAGIAAAATRTNLGLGATNNVVFNNITANNNLVVSNSLTTYGYSTFNDGILINYGIDFGSTNIEAATRTNLSLGATWLTNTNVTNFRTAIELGQTNTPSFRRVVVDPQASGALGIQYGANDSGLHNGANYNQLSLRVGGVNALTAETNGVTFANPSAVRTNIGLPLATLTNDSNATMMRALSGSTNTNEPYSGTVALTNTNAVLTFSNGILQSVQ